MTPDNLMDWMAPITIAIMLIAMVVMVVASVVLTVRGDKKTYQLCDADTHICESVTLTTAP